jgi:NCS1 family nucleobase:cation symporter-1
LTSTSDKFRMFVFGQPIEGEDSIAPIDPSKRKYNFVDMFLMFAGTQIAISFFVTGAGTVQGETVLKAFLAVLIGYGIIGGLLVALIGKIGFQEGIPTMVACRPSFGIRGSLLPVIVTIIELGGWGAVQIALGGNALALLLGAMSSSLATPAVAVLSTAFVGFLTLIICTRGGLSIKKMSLIVVPLLIISTIYIAVVAMGEKSIVEIFMRKNPGNNNWLLILDIMIVSALTWGPTAADYTRLGTSCRNAMQGLWWAFILIATFQHLIGMISAVGLGIPNPIAAMATTGFGGLFTLFTILFATLTTAVVIMYSTCMAIINVIESFSGKTHMWVVALILAIPLTVLATQMEVINFVIPYLVFLGYGLAPVFGIVLGSYFLVDKEIDKKDLYRENGGKYWGYKGFKLDGYGAFIIGSLAYYVSLNMIKPNHQWFMASVASILASVISYWIINKLLYNSSAGVNVRGDLT